MKIAEEINIQEIIKTSLNRSISYSEYKVQFEEFVAHNSTSGNEKTEDLIDYTMLNERRMKRWDKTIKMSEEVRTKVGAYQRNVTWLVLTESWCGDAAHVIPVLNKIAELSEHIDLRLVYRDENEALMNLFLTNGGKSIPKLIMIDNHSSAVLGTFGPRPEAATQLVLNYMAKHGALTSELKEALQHWYNIDKGQSTIADLLKLLRL